MPEIAPTPPTPTCTTLPGRCDIAVVGAGAVGLALAIGLARAGHAVACVGPAPPERDGRTVALLDGSIRFLAGLGVWEGLAAFAAPLATMRIVDGTGSLFGGPPVAFAAAELGLDAFGANIENAVLLDGLAAAAVATPGLTRCDALVDGVSVSADEARLTLAGGGGVRCRLVIAADGARSALREAAGIRVRLHRYPQDALTATLDHTDAHHDVSTEFHTREGPFTLVPMVPDGTAPHRSSLVWVMNPASADRRAALEPAAFAREIERQSRMLLGGVRVRGRVGRFPIISSRADRLVGPRLALAGEAAHALPPIGAQGLNLSLRDAACLVDLLASGDRGGDPGSPQGLARYDEARRGDIAVTVAGVDALNRSLLSAHLPVDALRGLGLAVLRGVPPLRRAVMRQGLSPAAPPLAAPPSRPR